MTNYDYPLQVYVFNVGQGEHQLLRLPDGSYGIIDSYFDPQVNSLREPPGLTFLKKRLQKKEEIHIRFLHFSNHHQDNFKGVQQWINWIEKNNIRLDYLVFPGTAAFQALSKRLPDFATDEEVLSLLFQRRPDLTDRISSFNANRSSSAIQALETFKKDCEVSFSTKQKKHHPSEKCIELNVSAIREIFLFEENEMLSVYCLAPMDKILNRLSKQAPEDFLEYFFSDKDQQQYFNEKEDSSNVLLFRFGQHDLIFGGDAGLKNIKASLKALSDKQSSQTDGYFTADFLKLFRQGDASSSELDGWENLLKKSTDVHIAISAGTNYKYNHPHNETIQDLEAAAEKGNFQPLYYPTNYQHLKTREDLSVSPPPMENISLWSNKSSVKKHKKQSKKKGLLTNAAIPETPSVDLRNNQFERTVQSLGFRFEFHKDRKEVTVVELAAT
ncbi:MAG: hypothetical protein AAF990_00760 [Bacteroidota bacterium]